MALYIEIKKALEQKGVFYYMVSCSAHPEFQRFYLGIDPLLSIISIFKNDDFNLKPIKKIEFKGQKKQIGKFPFATIEKIAWMAISKAAYAMKKNDFPKYLN